jgi:hypothetical protein
MMFSTLLTCTRSHVCAKFNSLTQIPALKNWMSIVDTAAHDLAYRELAGGDGESVTADKHLAGSHICCFNY